MIIQIYIALIVILFAVWNAYVIMWGAYDTLKKKYYSKVWHNLGLLIRFLLFFAPVFYSVEFWNWSLLFMASNVLYDFIINIFRTWEQGVLSVWHIDNKGFNKFFLKFMSGKVYWILRVLFVIVSIIVFIIKAYDYV